MILGTPEWVTEELKADYAKMLKGRRMVDLSEFEEFGTWHKLTAEQLDNLKARFVENAGGRIIDDSQKFLHCPNCGVKMVEGKP